MEKFTVSLGDIYDRVELTNWNKDGQFVHIQVLDAPNNYVLDYIGTDYRTISSDSVTFITYL